YLAHVRPSPGAESARPALPGILGRMVSGGLLGFQIFAATILLIFAITMAIQASYVAARPLGFSTANRAFISYYCPDGGRSDHAVMAGWDRRGMTMIRSLPGVKSASLFGGRMFRDNQQFEPFSRPGSPELGKATLVPVGPDALDLMQAKLLAGRLLDA